MGKKADLGAKIEELVIGFHEERNPQEARNLLAEAIGYLKDTDMVKQFYDRYVSYLTQRGDITNPEEVVVQRVGYTIAILHVSMICDRDTLDKWKRSIPNLEGDIKKTMGIIEDAYEASGPPE